MVGENKNVCTICKKKILNGDSVGFCPDCGGIVHTECLQNIGCNCEKKSVENEEAKMGFKKSTVVKIIAAVVCVIVAVIIGIFVDQNVNSVDDFCDRGAYKDAYGIAGDSEKEAITAEEFALPRCADIAYKLGLDGVDCLEFKDIYYLSNDDFTATVIVTEHTGSDNKTEKNYWLYALDSEQKEYFKKITDINEEKIYITDNEEQIEEKNTDNYARNLIKKVMSSDGVEIKVSGIRRINKWYKNGELNQYKTLIICTG